MPRKRPPPPRRAASPARQLAGFIAKFSPAIAAIAKQALPKMRGHFAGSTELVYDNYNALAIGWSPTGRTSDVICSIALYPRWVSVFFFRGKGLPDPEHRLRGSGAQVRHVVLEDSAATLDEPAIRALIACAIERSPAAPAKRGPIQTVIKSISAKQRPRRP
jgi:hypothetical protein